MPAADDPDRLWDVLEAKHGESALALRESVRSGERGQPERYRWDLKNVTLELSLDVSTGFSGAMYRSQLRRLLERAPSFAGAAKIVDVGCENGFVSLFLAELLPRAQVIGIDRSAAAIARGTELAGRLSVKNVEFVVGDFRKPPPEVSEADLLLLSRVVTADAIKLSPDIYTLADAPPLPSSDPLASEARAFEQLLAAGGQALIVERLANSVDAWRLVQALELAGLSPDWEGSDWIEGHEVGQGQRWPMLLVSRDTPRAAIEDVLQFFARTAKMTLEAALDDVCVAELLYLREARDGELTGGVQLEYPEGIERLEVRRRHDQVFAWLSSTLGFRRLAELPASTDEELRETLRVYAEEREAYAIPTFYDADSPPDA